MFYKFSQFAGRLMPCTPLQSVNPQGLLPLEPKPVTVPFESMMTRPWSAPEPGLARASSGSAVASGPATAVAPEGKLGIVPSNPRYKKLMERQTFFLKQDGKMVWQKMPSDRILYLATIGIVVVGTVLVVKQVLTLASPPKPRTD